jgi:hypothetical protein
LLLKASHHHHHHHHGLMLIGPPCYIPKKQAAALHHDQQIAEAGLHPQMAKTQEASQNHSKTLTTTLFVHSLVLISGHTWSLG